FGEPRHVVEDRVVRGAVLDRDEDALVHGYLNQPRRVSTSSQPLKPAISRATKYASALTQGAFTNSPIFNRSEVKRTSGNTAKDSCRLRITWLRIRSRAVPLSPKKIAVSTAGTIAINRVISRRSHGRRSEERRVGKEWRARR